MFLRSSEGWDVTLFDKTAACLRQTEDPLTAPVLLLLPGPGGSAAVIDRGSDGGGAAARQPMLSELVRVRLSAPACRTSLSRRFDQLHTPATPPCHWATLPHIGAFVHPAEARPPPAALLAVLAAVHCPTIAHISPTSPHRTTPAPPLELEPGPGPGGQRRRSAAVSYPTPATAAGPLPAGW